MPLIEGLKVLKICLLTHGQTFNFDNNLLLRNCNTKYGLEYEIFNKTFPMKTKYYIRPSTIFSNNIKFAYYLI